PVFHTLSLHDALPILVNVGAAPLPVHCMLASDWMSKRPLLTRAAPLAPSRAPPPLRLAPPLIVRRRPSRKPTVMARPPLAMVCPGPLMVRSEERRVGEEGRLASPGGDET